MSRHPRVMSVQLPADDATLHEIWALTPGGTTGVLLASATHDDFPWELISQLVRLVPFDASERYSAAPAALDNLDLTAPRDRCAVVVGRAGVTTDTDVAALTDALSRCGIRVLGAVVAASSGRRWRRYRRFATRFGYQRDPLRPWPDIDVLDRQPQA